MRENSYISSFKLLVKFILFAVIVISFFGMAGEKYRRAAEENVVNAFTKQRFDEFYQQERNSLDMVFIGSSHSYCTFDPEIVDGYVGTNSWQMGTPLQHADTSYYLLREIFEFQKPKIVVMELYWDCLDDEFELKQAEFAFEVIKNDELADEYVKRVFPASDKVKYSLPAIRYQQDYFAFKSNEYSKKIEEMFGVSKPVYDVAEGEEYYRSKGYVYCDIVMNESEFDRTNQFKYFDGYGWEINPVQREYLEKTVELCRENGAEIVFVTAPVAPVSVGFIKNYDVVHERLSEFAKSVGAKYIDFNEVNENEKILVNENFRDDAHLNHSGVQIVDEYFAKWLMKEGVVG
ncbi:MAG: hypothetical protein HFE62_04525 [Firmicutes bacterium]|nr:hypothetical protein [Bacillota bacterium]